MVAALLLGFSVLFISTLAVHDFLLRHAVGWSTEELLSQRLATLLDAVAATPETARDGMIRALAKPGLELSLEASERFVKAELLSAEGQRIQMRTDSLLSVATTMRVEAEFLDILSGHLVGVTASARLDDGAVLRVSIRTSDLLSTELKTLYVYASAFGLALLIAVAFTARTVAAPIALLARAVSALDLAGGNSRLLTTGPKEVQQLANALNGMAERTRDAFRQRTLALGALSHDLMSPLARLRLRAEGFSDAEREAVRRDVAEMETMISDVLAYLRGGEGNEPMRAVAVTALVRTVADEFVDAGNDVEIRRMDEAVLELRHVGVKRAVTNLLNNAFRHGERPWVEVEKAQDAVLIRVGDHGPGIPAEDLQRVTDPFFRGDRARTSGGGSGLGLATVRAVAEAHGGTLYLDSTPGEGTVATLRFVSPTSGYRR